MSEFKPVRNLVELEQLDSLDIMAGYWAGLANEPEPGSDKSRSYWHGWRNGRVDGGYIEPDGAQQELARQAVSLYRHVN